MQGEKQCTVDPSAAGFYYFLLGVIEVKEKVGIGMTPGISIGVSRKVYMNSNDHLINFLRGHTLPVNGYTYCTFIPFVIIISLKNNVEGFKYPRKKSSRAHRISH